MSFDSYSNIGNAYESGKFHYQYVIKPSLANTVSNGFWQDLSVGSGTPKYNAYAGAQLASNQLIGEGNAGIYPGQFQSGSTKHLVRWQADIFSAVLPALLYLCDYTLFYPLVDGDDLDVQSLDNTILPTRYANGQGVRAIVVVAAPMANNATLIMTYTNQDGVAGRTVTFSVLAGTNIGLMVACQGLSPSTNTIQPFVPLDTGDTGIQMIESIQMLSGSGGFLNFVLVKPLYDLQVLEASVSAERHFGPELTKLPEILPGAYLNILARTGVQATSWSLRSELLFVNS